MTYTIRAACNNCAWTGDFTLEKGEEVSIENRRCQCCGCPNLYIPVYVSRYDIEKKPTV